MIGKLPRDAKFEAIIDNLSWGEIISILSVENFEKVKSVILESLSDAQLDELYYGYE